MSGRRMTRRKFIVLAAGAAVVSAFGLDYLLRSRIPQLVTPPSGEQVVSIVRCRPESSYELVKDKLREAIDLVGGIESYVKPGESVLIKPNLTASYPDLTLRGSPYVSTDVRVVEALAELVKEAGTAFVQVGEGPGGAETFTAFRELGYEEMAERVGLDLVDLNEGPMEEVPVPGGGLRYESFRLNRAVVNADKLISVAKLKCHATAGVTLTMKNLFGIAPNSVYASKGTGSRDTFHSPSDKVPYVIVDLNMAKRMTLTIIDGMVGLEGGEGPWISDARPKEMDVFVAGNNPVATDAVGTAIMGFDPWGKEYPPFIPKIPNHLNIAREVGLGSNSLGDISVRGLSIQAVRSSFRPAPSGQA